MLALILLVAAPPYSPDAAARIVGGALSDGSTYARLAELTDGIGPRLSGSAGAQAAVGWALRKFEEDGVAARAEPVKVPHWVRGEERAAIVAARGIAAHDLAITALGGSPPTPATGIEAEVVEVHSLGEVEKVGDKLRGKIAFFDHDMSTPKEYAEFGVLRTRGPAAAAKFGAVAALVRSLATASLRSPHTGVTIFAEGAPQIPAAALATEDAQLIHRLLARGVPVRVSLTLGCRNLPEVESADVVAEIRGRERPQEIVLIGAHLDSWDLATGAIDDGAGTVVVLEAARLLAREKPRRTVRAVLFMNEENGLHGGKAYAAAHARETHVALLESDSGAGRPLSIAVHAGPGAQDLLAPWLPPLLQLGVDGFSLDDPGGADLSPLAKAGVPVAAVKQDVSRYFDVHHSAADTLDKVVPGDLARTAAAVAWVAYALAEMPGSLARAETPAETEPALAEPAAHSTARGK
jgi:carboxypeptidase Q